MIKIGKLVNTHGIKGEMRIRSNSDFKDIRFQEGEELIVKMKSGQITLKIASHYEHKTFDIVSFEGYTNINDVLQFKNLDIYARELSQDDLEDGEYFNRQLVGLQIENQYGEKIGIVKEVVENPGSNLLRIVDGEKKYLVPFNEQFINDVDLEKETIYIEEIGGLR